MQKHKNIAFILMGLLGGWAVQSIAADSTYKQLLPPIPSAKAETTTIASAKTPAENSLSTVSNSADNAIPILSSPPTPPSAETMGAAPPLADPAKEVAPLPRFHRVSTRSKHTEPKNQSIVSTAVSQPAKQAAQKSLAWANNPHALPTLGENGRIIFMYGDSAPTIICAPLRVCDIELEPGENVQGGPHIGDAVRWKVSPALSKENNQVVTHLIIKATSVGLDTNLIIPTDRRTYHLRLVSTDNQYASRVSFEYPETNALAWQKITQAAKGDKTSSNMSSFGDFPAVAIDQVHFNYAIKEVKGHPKFKPIRVMDDGARTFITMNDTMPVEEAPVVILIGTDKQEKMVNYRLKGNIFIIDRMVDKLALISGAGKNQQRIEITRDSCLARGFFNRCLSRAE